MYQEKQIDLIQNFIIQKIKSSNGFYNFWKIKKELNETFNINLDKTVLLKRIKYELS